MSLENIRNPATWLLDLWQRLPRDQLNQTSINVWAQILDTKTDHLSTLEGLTCVFANADQAESLTRRLQIAEAKKNQLLSWRDAFSNALGAVANNQSWQTTLQHFTEGRKVHLQYCALELDSALGEKSCTTREDMDDLASKIDGLIGSLESDESLDDDFKVLIRDLLETARRAVSEYRVRGNKGVFDSLSHIFSTLLRYQEQFDTPAKKQWSATIRETISILADVATVTGYSIMTISPAIGLLN